MVYKEAKYDPVRDLHAVDPFGFVDLKDAYVNKTVPTYIGESEEAYNGIKDPASIVGKPTDVFDALMMQSELDSKSSEYNKSEGDYNKGQ